MMTTQSSKHIDKYQYVSWLKKLGESQLDQEENNMILHLDLGLPSATVAQSKLLLVREEQSARKQLNAL